MLNWRGELLKYTNPRGWPIGKKALLFIGTVGLSYLATIWISDDEYSFNEFYTLWLSIMAMGLWLTEAVPAFAVGLFIIGFQVLTLLIISLILRLLMHCCLPIPWQTQ